MYIVSYFYTAQPIKKTTTTKREIFFRENENEKEIVKTIN